MHKYDELSKKKKVEISFLEALKKPGQL